MREDQIQAIREEANQAYRSRDFEKALRLSRELTGFNVPEAFLTCGVILEHGWHGSAPDLEGAGAFYSALAVKFNAEEGYLGFARIALRKKDFAGAAKAEEFCVHVIEKRRDAIAYLLLGRVYEELFGQSHYELAKFNYLKAGLRGSAWAWRKYAQLNMSTGHVIIGVAMHVFATLISPILVIVGGMRSSRRG